MQQSLLKRRLLFSIFLELCLLAILVPQRGEAVRHTSSPLSISPVSHRYAVLPLLSRSTAENLAGTKVSRFDIFGKKAPPSDTVAAIRPSRYLTPQSQTLDYLSSDTILTRDYQQACQLLDIPPPFIL